MPSNFKKYIPSIITALNLFCGSIATVFAFEGNIEYAVVLIIIAAVFDFLDGMAARLLNAVSEFGKQLDSLSDLISFGFAPSALLYNFITKNQIFPEYFSLLAFLPVVFAAWRLAKFNIDISQVKEFAGLPTPAFALFLISVIYYSEAESNAIVELINNQYFLLPLIIALCILMISNIRLFSLKFSIVRSDRLIWQMILIICSVFLLIIFGAIALAMIIILYLSLSIIRNLLFKYKHNRKHEIHRRN